MTAKPNFQQSLLQSSVSHYFFLSMCCFIFLWKPWCISRLRFFDEYIVQNNSIYMKWESFCNIINVNFFFKDLFSAFCLYLYRTVFQTRKHGGREEGGAGSGKVREPGRLKHNGSICRHAVHEAIGTDINVTFDQFNAFLLNEIFILFYWPQTFDR